MKLALALQCWAPRLALAAPVALTACGVGTVVVDYAIEAQVAIRDEAGRPRDTGTVERWSDPGSQFPAMRYRSSDFDWEFGTGTLGMGGWLTNQASSEICFRFDEARVRSNLHPEPLALSVYSFSSFRQKWQVLGANDPRTRQLFTPPKFCLSPAERARISMAPHLASLFPTAKMFNVRWLDEQPQLVDKGVGNWIAISLPVEIGERRETMDVKLTAVDSRARISTY